MTERWVEKLIAEYKELQAKHDKLVAKLPGLRKEVSALHFQLLRRQRTALATVLGVVEQRLRDAGVVLADLADDVDEVSKAIPGDANE